MTVRPATADDEETLVALRAALWPEGTAEEHRTEIRAILAGRPRSTLPLAILVAEASPAAGPASKLAGFIEVGLRSHADGCDPGRPCGFIEGWYVRPEFKGRGAGKALMAAAEAWCRQQGCMEIASDTWIDNMEAQRAHEALGFEVVDRCVNYRKRL
ncbi:MAG: GNAT family N-acetyltransferase [Deltaproteobacteria bacterium]|nr:GNAT family N-acetyltransferase [Deltaproteobacteria bacterium]